MAMRWSWIHWHVPWWSVEMRRPWHHRVKELLASGLDELMLTLRPLADEAEERKQLLYLIGPLQDDSHHHAHGSKKPPFSNFLLLPGENPPPGRSSLKVESPN